MQDKYNPLESIATAIAFSPRNWSSHHRDAWIYGIVLGWDKDNLEELKKRYDWTNETIARLKFLHDKYKILKNKNKETDRYRKALEAFQDDYFKGLDTTTIAELAKKSIRLTTENRKLEAALEEIEGILDNDDFGYCPLDDTEDCHHTTYKNILDIIADLRTDGG